MSLATKVLGLDLESPFFVASTGFQGQVHRFNGIVVSRTRGRSPMEAPIELLPPVADAVAGKVPVFPEGSVQRGSLLVELARAMGCVRQGQYSSARSHRGEGARAPPGDGGRGGNGIATPEETTWAALAAQRHPNRRHPLDDVD